ncbi:unnamed protein product, partial [Ixodes hexagonus]
ITKGPTGRDLKYFLDGLQADVEFVVGGPPHTRIKAHKLILAMRNVVFEAMFYGSMPEKGNVLIPDLHPDGFRGFLSYLYSFEAKFTDVETALHIKRAAQKYLELNLVELCSKFVKKNINPENICIVLDILTASQEPMSEYNDIIGEILRTKTTQVLDSNTFLTASESTIFEVLRREKKISEYDLLWSIFAWALANCSGVADTLSDRLLQTSIKPFLSEIKLLSLTPEEFVRGPVAWKILTVDEAYCILCNIIQRGSMPLPEFCKA